MVKLTLTGIGHPWSFELKPGLNRLGRNPTNDFRIPEASVSSFHCEIILSDGGVRVKDLCSTNGTFINQQQIQEGELKLGDVFHLGTAEFRIEQAVEIIVPEITRTEGPIQVFFEDGSPACLQHPTLPAAYKCTKCAFAFCASCVRILRRPSGGMLVFCPTCDGACEAVAPVEDPGKKSSFLGRLTQTLRIRFK